MSCHPTDPTNPIPEGSRAVPDGTTTRLCAGAEVLVQREAQRANDVMKAHIDSGASGDAFTPYRKTHPKGLTKQGAFTVMMEIAYTGMPGTVARTAVDLNAADVSHPDLVPWEPRS
jgi:hypothetical protein